MANGNPNAGPGAAAPTSPDEARRILAASAASVGRFQGPELFFSQDVNLATPSTLNVPRPLNLNRPAEGMSIILKGRIAVTAANMATVAPEAVQNLLQEILLNGTHRQYGNLTPIRLSGSTVFAMQKLVQGFNSDVIVNGVRQVDLGRPIVSIFPGTTASSPYDFIVVYNVPFGPQMGIGQSTKRDLASYLYQPADWGDTLQLQLRFGDATALGTLGGATVAFTAFGSGAGLPNVAIHLNYSVLGPFANALKTGVVIRQQQQFLGTFATAALSQRLSQLQKQITTGVLLKTGTTQTTTGGVNTFATLVDTLLDRTQIVVDNKPVRNNQSNFVMKAYLQRMFDTVIPAGYFPLSFVDGQNAQLSYRGDGLAGGSTYEIFSDILTSGGTQQIDMVQEMIYGGPFPPLRPA